MGTKLGDVRENRKSKRILAGEGEGDTRGESLSNKAWGEKK